MDPELLEKLVGIGHDVHQVRYGRALVAAEIAHARLQQGLGDGEDPLAAKHLARAQLQQGDLLGERSFRHLRSGLPAASSGGAAREL